MSGESPTDIAVEMLRSSLRAGWALSLVGVQETARWISTTTTTSSRNKKTAEPALGAATEHLEELLSPDAKEIFHALDRWQQGTLELVFGGFETPLPGELTRSLMRTGGAGISRRAFASMAPFAGHFEPDVRRSADVLEAFELFARGGEHPFHSPEQDIEGLLTGSSFANLWRLEGLGWARAESAFDNGELLISRLTPSLDQLPEAARMPLATGLGLSLAQRCLQALPANTEQLRAQAGQCLAELNQRCLVTAPESGALMVFETCGLIARQLIPKQLDVLAAAAAEISERHVAAFWHGVGRALYFSPILLRPGGAGRAIELAGAGDDSVARGNRLAGVLWAATLVHLRHPTVLDRVLASSQLLGYFENDEAAIRHGLAGALTVWSHYSATREPGLALDQEPLLSNLSEHYALAPAWPWVEQAIERASVQAEALRRGELCWDSIYQWLPEDEPS